MKEHISPCFWLSPPLAPDVSICSASSLIYEVPSLPCAQGFFSQLSGRWEESEKEKRQTGDTVRRSSKGQGTSLSQPPSGLRKRAWELCRTSSPHPLGWDCSFCCFSRPGSRTPCPSTTGSALLAPAWHPGLCLPPCVEEQTFQKTFTAVPGSGATKRVTDTGQVLARTPFPGGPASLPKGADTAAPSACGPRGLKANSAEPKLNVEKMRGRRFALHTQSKGISALAVSAGCAERSAIFEARQPIAIFGSYFANTTSETKSYFCPSGFL